MRSDKREAGAIEEAEEGMRRGGHEGRGDDRTSAHGEVSIDGEFNLTQRSTSQHNKN